MGNLWFGLVYIRLVSPVKKSGILPYLRAKVELEAVLLAFWCTIGTYLLTKDERQTPTELGDTARDRFCRRAAVTRCGLLLGWDSCTRRSLENFVFYPFWTHHVFCRLPKTDCFLPSSIQFDFPSIPNHHVTSSMNLEFTVAPLSDSSWILLTIFWKIGWRYGPGTFSVVS